ncbi:EAL domain-containing protein [Neobacillus mesonae]|nr:EAL domain-containing protein [Neobacillus mesonae]
MYNLAVHIMFLFIPFLFLFFMGIEVYLKNPRNKTNDLSMLLMFSLSLFFLGGFWSKTLPPEQALYVSIYVKYTSMFVTMTVGLYFFSLVTKIQIHSILKHVICLVPSFGILLLFLKQPSGYLSFSENYLWRTELLDPSLMVFILVATGYNFFMLLLFFGIGSRQRRYRKWQQKERIRWGWIKKGLIISLIWAVFWSIISFLKASFSSVFLLRILPYEIMPAYCILILACFIRYAMLHYDFLASPNRRYEILFRLSRHGIALVNDRGVVVEFNSAFQTSIGIPSNYQGEIIDLFTLIDPEKRTRIAEGYKENFKNLTPFHSEIELKNMLNESIVMEIDSDYLEMDDQIYCYLITRDITDKKVAETKLQKMAYEDDLTGLGNRLHFKESLQQAIEKAEIDERQVAVITLDLDQFKWINDTLGHSAGDLLLQHVARQIRDSMPLSATVARLGGDEFAITVPVYYSNDALHYANKIFQALQQPIYIFEKPYMVTASIGISLAPRDGRTLELLISNSDTALYAAKHAGRNQYYMYTPDLKAAAEHKLLLLNGLGSVLANNELTLYYQPQIDIHTNRFVGVEALLRWNSLELGVVSPAQFIPVAEETGMINVIGDWVLSEAFKQTKELLDQEFTGEDFVVSINLSARQIIEPLFIKRIKELLEQNELRPECICLEITESMAIYDLKKSLEVCSDLVELGFSLAMDDFGTGYSSLSMLNRFPFDYIKIDRSLVQDIVSSPKDAAVIQTIIELSERLSMEVVAEGVETEEQLLLLRKLGCHKAQGYLFARPMPAEQLTNFLRAN